MTVKFNEFKAELKPLKTFVKEDSTFEAELKTLLNLKDKYKDIMKIADLKERLDKLCDILLICSSYEERLVSIKNLFVRNNKVCKSIYSRAFYALVNDENFPTFRLKADKDIYVQSKLTWAQSVIDDYENFIERLNYVLEYVKNTGFNLKTIISSLKIGYANNG